MENPFEQEYQEELVDTIARSLLILLQEKHLFQSVKLDLQPLDKVMEQLVDYTNRYKPHGCPPEKVDAGTNARVLAQTWQIETDWNGPGAAPIGCFEHCIKVSVPTIRVECGFCKGTVQPHNIGCRGWNGTHSQNPLPAEGKMVQLFVLPFQCQNCKGEPLLFMVRREGLKMTLVGRSQFEQVAVPDFIPKDVAKYYTGAEIAFNTGYPLMAIFYLRTLIEQYMQGIVKPSGRMTGDDLAAAYAKTLPEDFKERYPSFSKAYDDLSGAMHEAREDEAVFKQALEDINAHFKAKPFFMVPRKASI